jgi:hypothetical protein
MEPELTMTITSFPNPINITIVLIYYLLTSYDKQENIVRNM